MATILESMKGLSAYPIPLRTLYEVAGTRLANISLNDEATPEILQSKGYNLAKADLLLWLSLAPNITQGGQSFSFTDEQRSVMKSNAYSIYGKLEPTSAKVGVVYGYKGNRL